MKQLPTALVDELREIASLQQRPLDELMASAGRDLEELDSRRGRLGSWMFAALSRFVRRRGYRQEPIHDHDELEQVRQAIAAGSVVFLVTHKTYLDFFVLFDFFYRQGLLPPRIFGGANMAFAGFGPLARRSGGIFIRRSFRDDPVYKAALNQRITELLEQKESFMWAIEGTRSRTGKLLIPRLGLLNYVTAAAKNLGESAVCFVPVAVVYDRIPDVADMAAQEAGARKQSESLSWFFGYLRKLKGQFGDIHIRFGAPIAPGETPEAPDLKTTGHTQTAHVAVQKLAFEACFQINQITPATMNSLVLLSLLCRGEGTPISLERDTRELRSAILKLYPDAQGRRPSRRAANDTAASISGLVDAGILEPYGPLPAARFRIKQSSLSEAIYYSNMAAHHLVIPAFAELALALMLLRQVAFSHSGFDAECFALRELFKFEFFFSRKATFNQQIRSELARLGLPDPLPDSQGPDLMPECLRNKPIRVATGVIAPYVPAYRAVAEQVHESPPDPAQTDDELIRRCLETARAAPATSSIGFRPGLSRALLANGLRVLDSRQLRSHQNGAVSGERCRLLLEELGQIEQALELLASMNQEQQQSPSG